MNNQIKNFSNMGLDHPLKKIIYKNLNYFFFTLWLIGFTDGEGSFIVDINKNTTMKTGYQVQLSFIITQHERDLNLLHNIKNFFDGYGEIKTNRGKNGGNVYQYRLRNFDQLNRYIIPLFENFELKTQKKLDFMDFKKVAELIIKKEHLTDEGVLKIKKIKEGMNRGRKIKIVI